MYEIFEFYKKFGAFSSAQNNKYDSDWIKWIKHFLIEKLSPINRILVGKLCNCAY